MGSFDVLVINCPNCGARLEYQSKGGSCDFREYSLVDIPLDVLSDVNRHLTPCSGCGNTYRIEVSYKAWPVVDKRYPDLDDTTRLSGVDYASDVTKLGEEIHRATGKLKLDLRTSMDYQSLKIKELRHAVSILAEVLMKIKHDSITAYDIDLLNRIKSSYDKR